jgi:hypothetical protein
VRMENSRIDFNTKTYPVCAAVIVLFYQYILVNVHIHS